MNWVIDMLREGPQAGGPRKNDGPSLVVPGKANRPDRFIHLRRIPLFSGLGDGDLEKIQALVRERKYKKGMIIFAEGEPGEAVYFIRCGKVKITRTSEDGREYIAHILSAGEIFAEVVLLGDNPYPATAEVVEDAEIGMIRNEDMENLIKTCPELALAIIKVMSKRLREAQNNLAELALKDAYRRISGLLISLASEHGVKTEEGVLIDLPLSRQEFAALTGTSRETVSRILSDLKHAGAVGMNGTRILIRNGDKLRELA